jgi:hypothetical protein
MNRLKIYNFPVKNWNEDKEMSELNDIFEVFSHFHSFLLQQLWKWEYLPIVFRHPRHQRSQGPFHRGGNSRDFLRYRNLDFVPLLSVEKRSWDWIPWRWHCHLGQGMAQRDRLNPLRSNDWRFGQIHIPKEAITEEEAGCARQKQIRRLIMALL